MRSIYVESSDEDSVLELIDLNLSKAKTVRDRNTSSTYLMVGSGFDIETSRVSFNDKDYAYCYHWQFGIGDCSFMGRSLDSMKDFIDLLIEYMWLGG